MNYSVRNILIAAGLAVAAIVTVMIYTSNVRKQAQSGQTLVHVLVAAKDIKPGTTFEQVRSGKLLVDKEVLSTDQLPGALTTASLSRPDLAGTILSQELFAGQQAPSAAFVPAASSSVPNQLQRNQRAFQLSFDADAGLAGTLHSGDHVDILIAVGITKPDGSSGGVTRRLLSDVEVLRAPGGASDAATESDSTSSDNSTQHVLLKVTDSEANKLLWAEKFSQGLSLILRPRSHAEDGAVTAQTVNSVLLDGLNDKQLGDLLKRSAITAN